MKNRSVYLGAMQLRVDLYQIRTKDERKNSNRNSTHFNRIRNLKKISHILDNYGKKILFQNFGFEILRGHIDFFIKLRRFRLLF